jgi:hypothetical protein
MKRKHKKTTSVSMSTAENIRNQIESGGERIWRLDDFKNMPFTAVAQTLSRLSKKGVIRRISKGLYYRSRQTPFGESKPSPSQLHSLHIQRKDIFPAGNAASNLLGFTTQNAAKIEVATNGLSLPRSIVGKDTIIHTRRPESWRNLSTKDAALLDFLRQGGKTSELSPKETVKKLLEHFDEKNQFDHLIQVAESEPPRVRALLGAIGQQIGCRKEVLIALKKSLNSLSKFDFGNLIALKYAKQWQAKDPKPHEII